MAGWATSTSPRRLVRAASSPNKVPRWPHAAAPSSVSVRPRAAEGKVAHPRRTYNLEMKRFEICDATLLTRSTSSVFASCIWCTRALTRVRLRWRVPLEARNRPPQQQIEATTLRLQVHAPLPAAALAAARGRGGGCGRVWSSGHARAVAETAGCRLGRRRSRRRAPNSAAPSTSSPLIDR